MSLNDTKKKEIENFLKSNPDKSFTMNQIKEQVKIHIYKVEVLLNKLFYEDKVKIKNEGKYSFWQIK